ncbi:MAG: hypothetical protein Q4D96_09325 [Propionibacteriaceae bacterium]|nr:hypothetical protein [Propionibacteriaceae bacterium]
MEQELFQEALREFLSALSYIMLAFAPLLAMTVMFKIVNLVKDSSEPRVTYEEFRAGLRAQGYSPDGDREKASKGPAAGEQDAVPPLRAAAPYSPCRCGGSCEVAKRRAEGIVAAIQEQIGEYRLDLDFVLEGPGFFDVAFPEAKRFWEALTEWEDHHHTLTGREALGRAEQLERLFEDAVTSARASGLDYMPAATRLEARTAQKLAAKATRTNHGPERDALMERVARILSELNLAFLSRQEVAALTASTRYEIGH